MSKVYVIAVLGTAPAVLSELIWWIRNQNLILVGCEIWTTKMGAHKLLKQLPQIQKLYDLDDRDVLSLEDFPEITDSRKFDLDWNSDNWRLVYLHNGSEKLDDIRTLEDIQAIDAGLYNRLQFLTEKLPEDIQLLGSLAGGRKTMSASLQSAFAMQGRWQDRLVHVLVHPKIEEILFDKTNDFVAEHPYFFPTKEWEQYIKIPMEDQVLLYDVPYPRVKEISKNSQNIETINRAISQPYQEVWETIIDPRKTYQLKLFDTIEGEWLLSLFEEEELKLSFHFVNKDSIRAWICLLESPTGIKLKNFCDQKKISWFAGKQRFERLRKILLQMNYLAPQYPIFAQLKLETSGGEQNQTKKYVFSMSYEKKLSWEEGKLYRFKDRKEKIIDISVS